jgi:hydroxymethylglutaryl-CoA lyase
VSTISNIAAQKNKELLVYLSMGFGNPYGDVWNADVVFNWANKLSNELGVKIVALSDTVGVATPNLVSSLFKEIIPALPNVEFGAHLHVVPQNANNIIEAAYNAGCRRFDGAIKGFGGCPMAEDDLTGNMPTEILLAWLENHKIHHGIDNFLFEKALQLSTSIFPNH